MNNLKKCRESKNLSQHDVASKIGVSRVTYTRYENGSREPDYETLKKLADFFDVTTDYLLEVSENKNETRSPEEERVYEAMETNPKLKEAIERILKLSPELQQEANDYLEYLINKELNRK